METIFWSWTKFFLAPQDLKNNILNSSGSVKVWEKMLKEMEEKSDNLAYRSPMHGQL